MREGLSADAAQLAASLSGGQLARARALAGPLANLRTLFAHAPGRLDGTGATALAIAEQLDAAVSGAADEVARQHAEELAEFDAEMERYGYSDRDAQRMRRRVDERHKREAAPDADRPPARRRHRDRNRLPGRDRGTGRRR